MQLFYQPEITKNDREVIFSREESRHIVRVLRKKEGDILQLTNGKGWKFETKITSANHNKCIAEILTASDIPALTYYIHMAVAPTKKNERFEWFLEKSTEMGVNEITPLLCDHSERKTIKPGRYEKILQSAMKQSMQSYLPLLHPATELKQFLRQDHVGQKFIAHCEEGQEKVPLFDHIEKNTTVTVLIGPEGDFSPEEIQEALTHGWKPVSLGSTRLRTETAAILACHTIILSNAEKTRD